MFGCSDDYHWMGRTVKAPQDEADNLFICVGLGGGRRQEDSGLQLSRREGIDRARGQWRTKGCRGRRQTKPSQASVRCRVAVAPSPSALRVGGVVCAGTRARNRIIRARCWDHTDLVMTKSSCIGSQCCAFTPGKTIKSSCIHLSIHPKPRAQPVNRSMWANVDEASVCASTPSSLHKRCINQSHSVSRPRCPWPLAALARPPTAPLFLPILASAICG